MGPQSQPTRTKNVPIAVNRSRRNLHFRNLSTLPAGKVVPLLAFPLLREDALDRCQLQLNFELAEMVEVCANPIMLNVRAYLVPNLAFPRFLGSYETLNRSYMGEAEPGGAAVHYFQGNATEIGPQDPADPNLVNSIYYHLGIHVPEGATYNTAYVDAYNCIWNQRARDRSPDIEQTPEGNRGLLPAFWRHPDLGSIVPNFDQATIDGEVPLNVVGGRLPVQGIALTGAVQGTQQLSGGRTPGNIAWEAPGHGWAIQGAPDLPISGGAGFAVKQDQNNVGFPEVFAELQENGITVSLANIELARKTQAFALMRKQYAGYDDQYLIDLLMSGINLPLQAEKEPILLANVMSTFGQAKRFATDSVDLTASVASGTGMVQMSIRTPKVNSGGVIMVTAEFYPEQLWERREDPYLAFVSGDGYTKLPDFLRDDLDPEKVEVVKAGYVDVRHSTPDATFGYEALNARWNTYPPRVGGKFYRPEVDLPADEDRQRIWASETADPTLSEDFYLVTNLHTKPFVVTDQDPCESLVRGSAVISGNTVFGRLLIEGEDDYDTIMGKVDMDRIEKVDPLDAPGMEDGIEEGLEA